MFVYIQLNEQTVLFLTIKFWMLHLFGSDGNKRALCIPQCSIIIGTSPPDWGGGLTPLLRRSQFILQPQPPGLLYFVCTFLRLFTQLYATNNSVGWGGGIYQWLLCSEIKPPFKECPTYNIKQSDDEVLELWVMCNTSSLPLLPDPL